MVDCTQEFVFSFIQKKLVYLSFLDSSLYCILNILWQRSPQAEKDGQKASVQNPSP